MKKNKLDSNYEVDFDLLGIVCNKKEYKIAWHLNQALSINLIKQDDVRITFKDSTSILISNFVHETELLKIELIQNRLVASGNFKNQVLIPELSQFDYLIKLKDQTGEMTIENVNVIIKEIPIIEYVASLNFDNLKSKENLLY